MAKRDVPTTVFVPPFPVEALERDQWSNAVAGFCNGAQSVKINDDVDGLVTYSTRTGAVVYVQAWITTIGTFCNVDILPVAPRTNGFISAYNSAGEVTGLVITAGSKLINMCDLPEEEYYITGSYLASLKERGT